jgi:HemY protein
MIRLIFRFLLLAAAAAFFAWIADRPGTVVIRWMNREIETSVLAALAGAILVVLALWIVLGLLRRLLGAPSALSDYFRFRRTRRGYEALSRGIVAAGAGDGMAAQRFALTASRTLTDEPLLKLLEVQAAQIRGDRTAVRRGFEAMLKVPQTEILGLRGLFAEARAAGDTPTARSLAERALKLNPSLGWASSAMLAIQSAEGDWTGALATLENQRKSGQTGADEARQKRAILVTARALAAEAPDRALALKLALEAHRLDPGLVPAATLAARIYSHLGSQRKVWKVVNRTWAKLPHPDLATAYAYARPGDSPQARFERVRQLVKSHDGGVEGTYALARAALAAQQWSEARRILEPVAAAGEPQARFCALMADLEEGESGDKGRAREWLARAMRAPRDPMWVVDGVAVPQWTPLSPVTGEVAEAQWKVPYELLPSEAPPSAEPPQAEPAVPEEPQRIAAASPAAGESAAAQGEIAASPAPASPPPAPVAQASPPRPVMVKPLRPPDDPGPNGGEPFPGTGTVFAGG